MSGERTPLLKEHAAEGPEHLSAARKRFIVATALLTGFLSTLDLTIVATCIATISSELKSSDQEAWIGTAYLWSNVTFTPLYGRLSDLLGRRTAYLQAIILFTVGTFFCGCATSFPMLVIARFVAGMGGGGMGTVSSVLMADIFSPAERSFYQGLSFAVFGAGTGLGGPIGGLLTQAFGWRAAFYAQVPVAVISIICALISVPSFKHEAFNLKHLKQIDFGGSFSLLISIGALLQLLSRTGGSESIAHDPFSIAMAVIFPVFFLIFIFIELKVASKPVLPLSLLTRRTPLCVGIIAGVIAIVNFNMIYHLPMVFEIVFQQPVSVAGAHLLPNSIAMTISAPIMGYIVKRTSRYKWLTVLNCAGPVVAMALLTNLKVGSSWANQWLSVVPMGAGFSGLLTLTLKHEIATSTGFVFVWRSLGQVFGVGLSSAVFQGTLSEQLNSRFDSPEIIDKLRHASQAIKTLPEEWQKVAARQAYGISLKYTFLFGLLGALGVFTASLFIPNDTIHNPSAPVQVAPIPDEEFNEEA
ncbi:integral membrane protein [Cryptococcus bacillisporus CA1873]|uniref:Integral membrane protein n=1 Tax=Cryptococcus bacillisporus CA1873 TaxID=1296111 RepID=A0ABR5B2C1_CRYGA|nr:integral membrane protein [Cryptococcus bacillisporus CA1873]|eukprot:KIR57514.1 integral membrane protein [Cryptococcus gattii CA1873]